MQVEAAHCGLSLNRVESSGSTQLVQPPIAESTAPNTLAYTTSDYAGNEIELTETKNLLVTELEFEQNCV